MRRSMMYAALAAILMHAPVAAGAACAPSDMEGIWRAYVFGQNDGGQAFWDRCTLGFDAGGEITPPRNSCIEHDGDRLVLAGTLNL